MLRQRLITVWAVALLAATASAGEIHANCWPTTYVPVEIADIPVVMDVGFWVEIVNQDDIIKLHPVSVHQYQGCLNLKVLCNFDLTLSCSIAPTGAVDGKYSCFMQDAAVDAPGGYATVCAQLDDAKLGDQMGGTRDVQVATVTIRVVPGN